jgi:hypothetical protein
VGFYIPPYHLSLHYAIVLHLLNNMLICTQAPSPGARVVYIDGAFDLFHAGHVEVPFFSHADQFTITYNFSLVGSYAIKVLILYLSFNADPPKC